MSRDLNRQETTLVLGGTGKTGRRVAGRLRARGLPAHAEDIADVAVAALAQDGHAGRIYEVTGPRALRFGEAVDEIAGASGRPVRFVPVTIEQFAAAMQQQSVPGDVVSLVSYLFTEVLDGRNARLADGVQRAFGREPRDLGDYARRTAAASVWDGAR
jgi:uncharacterized protein YbjT (DUF2867 family)